MGYSKLTQYKDLIELVTGLVVIVSLIFVGIEIRQNTAAIKMDAYQIALDKLDHRSYMLATDKELFRIVQLAADSGSELSEEEWSRVILFTLPHLAVWEFLHDAHTKDNIDRFQYQGFERYFIAHLCTDNSVMRRAYHENIDIWSDPFLEYVTVMENTKC